MSWKHRFAPHFNSIGCTVLHTHNNDHKLLQTIKIPHMQAALHNTKHTWLPKQQYEWRTMHNSRPMTAYSETKRPSLFASFTLLYISRWLSDADNHWPIQNGEREQKCGAKWIGECSKNHVDRLWHDQLHKRLQQWRAWKANENERHSCACRCSENIDQTKQKREKTSFVAGRRGKM